MKSRRWRERSLLAECLKAWKPWPCLIKWSLAGSNAGAGGVYYTYADKQNDLVYIGTESEYQRYKQLGQQRSIAQSQLDFTQMDEAAEQYNSPIF